MQGAGCTVYYPVLFVPQVSVTPEQVSAPHEIATSTRVLFRAQLVLCVYGQVADFGMSRELMLTAPIETASYGTVTHSAAGMVVASPALALSKNHLKTQTTASLIAVSVLCSAS